MSSPKKFDPPESVVGPAFSELLNRLSRSRVRVAGGVEMSEEEQKIFDYGVTERKRVLEHTLYLVFGQWAAYRQLVSRLKSRGLRVAYGVGAFVSTGYFVGARARRVSHEMFATIATTPTTSPLGNEARVVLAELEGPDGPYFRRICKEKGFNEDLPSVLSVLDAKDGIDPASDHVHPQLRLRPRLPVLPRAHEDAVRVARARDRDRREGMGIVPPPEVDFKPVRVYRGRAYLGPEEMEERADGRRGRWETRETKKRAVRDETQDDNDDLWGKPFDFKASAGFGRLDSEAGDNSNAGEWYPEDAEGEKMMERTPSQKRADERRERRSRAQRRLDGHDNKEHQRY